MQRKRGLITRAKRAFAALAVTGMVVGCYGTTCRDSVPPQIVIQETDSGAERTETPNETDMPFYFRVSQADVPERYCNEFPEIEEFSRMNDLDPLFVRAVIANESGFESCAAVRSCRAGFDGPGCFEPGPGQDAGYEIGFDEMHDPDGRCTFTNAPNSASDNPDWRFLALGLMQTLEPPHTYWPANHRTDNTDGAYFVLSSNSDLHPWNLDDAKECNPRFNPFNSRDSVCLGTKKLRDAIRHARSWVGAHPGVLNWDRSDTERDRIFTMYVAAHIYAGTWQSNTRISDYIGRCPPSLANGDCWMHGFEQSWTVDSGYCREDATAGLPMECEAPGVPRYEPPNSCYGVTDFMQYMRDCEIPLAGRLAGIGQRVMEMYYRLRNSCR